MLCCAFVRSDVCNDDDEKIKAKTSYLERNTYLARRKTTLSYTQKYDSFFFFLLLVATPTLSCNDKRTRGKRCAVRIMSLSYVVLDDSFFFGSHCSLLTTSTQTPKDWQCCGSVLSREEALTRTKRLLPNKNRGVPCTLWFTLNGVLCMAKKLNDRRGPKTRIFGCCLCARHSPCYLQSS